MEAMRTANVSFSQISEFSFAPHCVNQLRQQVESYGNCANCYGVARGRGIPMSGLTGADAQGAGIGH